MNKINYIAGLSISNMFIHVTQEDWGLGDTEAFAHFDGREWKWIGVTNGKSDFVTDMEKTTDGVVSLSVDGCLYTFPRLEAGGHQVSRLTECSELFRSQAEPPVFRSIASGRGSALVVVGDSGLICTNQGSPWRKLTGTARSDFTCTFAFGDKFVIGCNDGIIYEYDFVELSFRYTIAPLSVFAGCSTGSAVYLAAGRGEEAKAIMLDMIGLTASAIAVPSMPYSICATSHGVYCSTGRHGIFRINQSDARPTHLNLQGPGRVVEIDDHMVTSGYKLGQTIVAAVIGQHVTEIPFCLNINDVL